MLVGYSCWVAYSYARHWKSEPTIYILLLTYWCWDLLFWSCPTYYQSHTDLASKTRREQQMREEPTGRTPRRCSRRERESPHGWHDDKSASRGSGAVDLFSSTKGQTRYPSTSNISAYRLACDPWKRNMSTGWSLVSTSTWDFLL